MKKIFKYPIAKVDRQELVLPKGARILSAINQSEEIMLYALVDPEADHEERSIYIQGTGWEAADDILEKLQFVGTVELQSGALVFHVFAD